MNPPTRTMSRRGSVLVGLGAAAVGVGLFQWRGRDEEASSSRAAATPAASDLWQREYPKPDGSLLRMADFRGREVMLNFWATWCPPCVREFPLLDRFHQTWSPRGWSVVGLALDQPEAVRGFLNRLPVSFPIGVPGVDALTLSKALGNEQGALPFTVAFDRTGRPKGQILGEATMEKLEALART